MPTLGQSLTQMLSNLTDIIISLPDGPQRDKLIDQHKALAARIHTFVDNNVPTATAEYVKATTALQGANDSLVAARADIQKVAQTITKIAQVVEALSELAAMFP